MKETIVPTILIAISAANLTACTSNSGEPAVPPADSRLAALDKIKQDPSLPHPGRITLRYLWNQSERIENAADWPEGITFFCLNEKHERVERDQATWCIPLVEFETFSVDEHGKPVPPREASFIERFEYGPDHTFIRVVSTPPVRTPPPELRTPAPPSPRHNEPQSRRTAPPDPTMAATSIGTANRWTRLKQWMGWR
ncbi:hypothetical protein [Burkholderia sp. Ac-20379]|uniref:hypothetical protein n=1 Tax=Burkholderia sp. Ac-20379 TaxID=2703900 RepID=UPI00197D04D4|nr:hypothetical protein [Burkholderia sp. Ac-20379]MBN3728668.1 hypothetical protein [Burkholderia sp. Ac-20379]